MFVCKTPNFLLFFINKKGPPTGNASHVYQKVIHSMTDEHDDDSSGPWREIRATETLMLTSGTRNCDVS